MLWLKSSALPSALFAIDTDSDGLDDSVETNTGVYVSPSNTGTNPTSFFIRASLERSREPKAAERL